MTNTRPRVLATWHFPDDGLQLLTDTCDLTVWEGDHPMSGEELQRGIADMHGLFCSPATDRIDAALLQRAAHLRVVSNFGVGYDNVDVPAATSRGIWVCNTPGVLTDAVADQTFALLLAVARRVSEAERLVHDGQWRHWHPTLLVGKSVGGASLGVVGMGGIGSAVARRAAGFGMRIRYTSRERKSAVEAATGAQQVSLDTLLHESDYVSLHTALTPGTRHLIGDEEFRRMRPSAVLINTARGGVVDQAALTRALLEGRIAGAGLDVTNPEPISMDDPLLGLANCVIVPHIGSATVEARARMSVLACENLLAVLQGRRPRYAVNEGELRAV